MAAALLKNKMPKHEIKSAGIFANENSAPNSHAVRALNQYDIQLSHKSTQVTEKLLHWADLVLAMTVNHVQSLINHYPQFQEKYFTLKQYALHADNKVWDQLQDAYRSCESKRSQIIKEYQFTLDQRSLEERIDDQCKEDMQEIKQLEAQLVDYSISDPFGGTLEIYERTLAEIHTYIEAVVAKTKHG